MSAERAGSALVSPLRGFHAKNLAGYTTLQDTTVPEQPT